MSNTYQLTVSTPDGEIMRAPVAALMLRGADGDLAILSGHAPLVTTVKPGLCRVDLADGTEKHAQTGGGILSVTHTGVTLLCGDFQWQETE